MERAFKMDVEKYSEKSSRSNPSTMMWSGRYCKGSADVRDMRGNGMRMVFESARRRESLCIGEGNGSVSHVSDARPIYTLTYKQSVRSSVEYLL